MVVVVVVVCHIAIPAITICFRTAAASRVTTAIKRLSQSAAKQNMMNHAAFRSEVRGQIGAAIISWSASLLIVAVLLIPDHVPLWISHYLC